MIIKIIDKLNVELGRTAPTFLGILSAIIVLTKSDSCSTYLNGKIAFMQGIVLGWLLVTAIGYLFSRNKV